MKLLRTKGVKLNENSTGGYGVHGGGITHSELGLELTGNRAISCTSAAFMADHETPLEADGT